VQELSGQDAGISRAHITFFKSNIIQMKVFIGFASNQGN